MKNKAIKILKKPLVFIPLILLVIIVFSGFYYFKSQGSKSPEFVLTKKQDIIQEISITGKVKASQSLDLAFEKTGKVAGVFVVVGDKVQPYQTIVSLDNSELSAQLLQAEAGFESEQAKLDEIKKGTRPEEIALQEIATQKSESALADAEENMIDKIQDSFTKSDDAVKNKADQLFLNPSANPTLDFTISDFQLEVNIENQREDLESIFISWGNSLDNLTAESDLDLYTSQARNHLKEVKTLLDKIASALNKLSVQGSITQTKIDTWKTDISTARTNINTATSNITTAFEKLKTAESDLISEKEQLNLDKAGNILEQVSGQEAKVKSALANIQNIKAQISKTYIYSPISGIIAKQEAKKGEIIGANSIVISIISDAKFEIEANVTEVDIAKIKIGDIARVTLDAFSDAKKFEAKIIKIDPAETVIDGVATYKTTFQFQQEEERIKPGMTANIDIQGQSRSNVLAVPYRSVIKNNGNQFVKVLIKNEIKEVEVKTGLKGSDGNIEIIQGLQEGDKILK